MNELLLSVIAQDAGPPPGCAQAASPLFMMAVVFGIFYGGWVAVLPAMIDALKRGDRVVTTGGLIGSIHALTDNILTLEVAEKTRVRVLRSQIANLLSESPAEASGESAEKGK